MTKNGWLKGVFLAILISVGGWAIFNLALNLFRNIFAKVGITDDVYISLGIIVVVVILLIIGWGTGMKTAIKKLVD